MIKVDLFMCHTQAHTQLLLIKSNGLKKNKGFCSEGRCKTNREDGGVCVVVVVGGVHKKQKLS